MILTFISSFFKRRIVESDLFVGFGVFVKFWFIVDVWIHFYIQQLLVWKFILWTFSLTVGKSVSTAGTQLGKRNLEVLEMDISEYSVNF